MAWAAPISVYPQNPHYFLYRGKPIFYSMGACAFELEYIAFRRLNVIHSMHGR
jgi:poly-gamma-glutamate capsule biosynthesis protein CapA/YwtB (metallophosphatase superfamily)